MNRFFPRGPPRVLVALAALATAVTLIGCSTSNNGGQCGSDDDCADGQACLVDLVRGTSYCTIRDCDTDDDCPDFQSCRFATVTPGSTDFAGFCVDQVRSCVDEDGQPNRELCNGLDDDCDGVVDGPNCELITQCNSDDVCGAFVCTAPNNQPTTVCAPPNAAATAAYFEPCTRDDECPNGLCESGICSPICISGTTTCGRELVGPNGEGIDLFCTGGIGPGNRPPHNVCHKVCALTASACTQDEICAWRAVVQPRFESRLFVCAVPDMNRAPLGVPCSRNDFEGDNECQHGLCFGGVCTRICRRATDDCSADLGPGFVCRARTLIYGIEEFPFDICVRSN